MLRKARCTELTVELYHEVSVLLGVNQESDTDLIRIRLYAHPERRFQVTVERRSWRKEYEADPIKKEPRAVPVWVEERYEVLPVDHLGSGRMFCKILARFVAHRPLMENRENLDAFNLLGDAYHMIYEFFDEAREAIREEAVAFRKQREKEEGLS